MVPSLSPPRPVGAAGVVAVVLGPPCCCLLASVVVVVVGLSSFFSTLATGTKTTTTRHNQSLSAPCFHPSIKHLNFDSQTATTVAVGDCLPV